MFSKVLDLVHKMSWTMHFSRTLQDGASVYGWDLLHRHYWPGADTATLCLQHMIPPLFAFIAVSFDHLL